MELKKIHSDDRGDIYILEGDFTKYPEITLFRTNEGYARGGCIHNVNSEFVCVLEGEIEYVYGDDMQKKLMKAGDTLSIPKSTPHYFLSLTRSLVAEWGATPEEKSAKHLLFRALVDEINTMY